MGLEEEHNVETIRGQLLKVSFKTFGRITVSLPLGSLLFCFTTAMLFKFDEVNTTECHVSTANILLYNVPNCLKSNNCVCVCVCLEGYVPRSSRSSVGLIYF